jgi:trimethylamine--corrinoid protein Co-methyltransferase
MTRERGSGNGAKPRFPGGLEGGTFKPLSVDDIKKIHEATVEVLSEVGFEVHSRKAPALFEKEGIPIDPDTGVARVPEKTLMSLIDRAPAEVVLCGREEKHDLHLGGKRVYLGPGGTALNMLDSRTGVCRRAEMKDLIDVIRLVDALENIHFLLLPTYPNELELDHVDVNRFFAGLNHTTKHVMGGVYTSEGIDRVIRMAETVAGSPEALRERPFISLITCGISPLRLDGKYGDFMIQVAREGIPVAVPSEPMCGATSPVTLAGNLLIQNCDTLINVLTAQIANPGTPVICGSVATSTDLKDLSYLGGSVESGLINAGAAQMAQYYSIPYYATAGISDAKTIDVQCGYEAAVNNLMVALAGANFIHDAAGLMEFALTVCKEKYVVDNEILGMAMRAVKGIEVNEETLALKTIAKVGPGGNFVSARHTRKYMRKEHYKQLLSDRLPRKDWEEQGRLDGLARAQKTVDAILGEPPREILDPAVRAELMKSYPEIESRHYA